MGIDKMRRLILLRHAKSDWHGNAETDYDRPLNRRGQKAIQLIAKTMRTQGIQPRTTLSSPARRAAQTVTELYDALETEPNNVDYLPELYLADRNQLLQIIERDQRQDLMIVGHNPGLEALLLFLCGNAVPRTNTGKLFPTASLAVVRLPDDWSRDLSGQLELEALLRPKELESEYSDAPR